MRVMRFFLMSLIAAVSFSPSSRAQAPADSELLRAIDALQAPLRDFYCEYEGERLEEQAALDKESSVYEKYSGRFKYKNNDKFLNDIYHDYLPSKVNPQRALNNLSILSNEAGTHLFTRADGSPGSALRRRVHPADFDVTGSYGRIFLVRYLRELLKYDQKKLIYEGTEAIGKATCERYAVVLGDESGDVKTGIVHRFWIDMNRNAHVLKKESLTRGRLLSTTSDIELNRFGPSAEGVWLPVSGRFRAFSGRVIAAEESYWVMVSSVRVNRSIGDPQFTLKYPAGTPVTDHLKGVVHQFGEDTRPLPTNLAEAESRLDDALRKARETRSDLVASSWSRGNYWDWAVWLPLSVFVITGLSAGVFYHLHRRGRL
jgi:hypothetical protein